MTKCLWVLLCLFAAVVNYKRAIELDPSSTSNREYLEKAEAKLRAGSGISARGAGGDGDDEVSIK